MPSPPSPPSLPSPPSPMPSPPLDLTFLIFFPPSNFRLHLFPNPIPHISSLLPIPPSPHPAPPHHTPLLLPHPLLPSFPLPTPSHNANTAQRLTSNQPTTRPPCSQSKGST